MKGEVKPLSSTAVIILKDHSRVEILGLPVIKRLVLVAAQAGLKNIILLGRGDTREEELVQSVASEKRIEARGIKLTYLPLTGDRIDENKSPLEPIISERVFWLISGDLVLSEKVFDFIKERKSDTNRPLIFTADEAQPANQRPSGLDLTFCPSDVWPVLREAWKNGHGQPDEEKLTAWLIEHRSAEIVRLPSDWLIKINSPEARKKAIKMLLASARKPQDGFIARHFNRRVSLFFTRFLAPLRVKPSVLSLINFLIGISAAAFCASGKNYWHFLAGGFLFEFSSIFDGCDGEVARLTYQTSEKGGLLDVIFDALTYILFFSALAIGLYRNTGNSIFLWMLGLFLGSVSWYYFNLYHLTKKAGIGNKIYLVAKQVEAQGQSKKDVSLADRLAAKLAFALRRDFFATLVFGLLALNLPVFLLGLVTAGALVESIYVYYYRKEKIEKAPA